MSVDRVLTEEEIAERELFVVFMQAMNRMRRATSLKDLEDLRKELKEWNFTRETCFKLNFKLGFHTARVTKELAR
jgi:hypothetical protein